MTKKTLTPKPSLRRQKKIPTLASESYAYFSQRLERLEKRYGQLKPRATEDAIALKQEREKTARLEDTVRGKDTDYQTLLKAKNDLDERVTKYVETIRCKDVQIKRVIDDSESNIEKFNKYELNVTKKIRDTKIVGLLGWCATAIFAVITYLNSHKYDAPSYIKPTPPTATAMPKPLYGNSYDPRAKDLEEIEKDIAAFIVEGNQAGEDVTTLGFRCNDRVLGELYFEMRGIEEGRDYFLNTLRTSKFCNDGVP